ncbi:hypothetical protein D3C72_1185230 [compost metagenome]
MSSTPLIFCSKGAATVSEITEAEAPGYFVVTLTCGGTIGGYCSIGKAKIEASPAIIIMRERTVEKTGLSIKNFEIMEPHQFSKAALPI